MQRRDPTLGGGFTGHCGCAQSTTNFPTGGFTNPYSSQSTTHLQAFPGGGVIRVGKNSAPLPGGGAAP